MMDKSWPVLRNQHSDKLHIWKLIKVHLKKNRDSASLQSRVFISLQGSQVYCSEKQNNLEALTLMSALNI